MRILFLTSHFPYPPHSGGALRAYGLIKGVVAAGHQVELFCFAENLPTDSPLHHLLGKIYTVPPPQRSMAMRLKDLLLTQRADMSRRFWSEEAFNLIAQRLEVGDIDIVHAESIEMAAYIPALHTLHPQQKFIYGSLNAEADLQRSIFKAERGRWQQPRDLIGAVYSWVQWQRLTTLEAHIGNLAAHVLAVSEEDAALLQALSKTPVTVVKNGIDTADYRQLTPNDGLGGQAIVFTGTMDYRPNVDATVWFAEEILPTIIAQLPTAQFYAVGNRPHPRVQALASRPNITITGRVDSMATYWQGATVYVAPLRMGSGTRFKILEAMAAGCAVVSTTMGAMGLGVTSGQAILLADSPEDFAQAVLTLLKDKPQRATIAAHGRRFVQENFDWSVIVPQLLDVYRDVKA